MTTLSKVKSYLQITDSTYDTVLGELIANVTAFLKTYLDRDILTGTYTEYFDGCDKEPLLREYPVASITTLKYNAGTQATPDWQTVSAENYIIHKKFGKVQILGGVPDGYQNVEIIYVGGYASYPDDLEMVAKQLVAKAFEQRKAQGKSNETISTASVDWKDSITPEQEAVLAAYRSLNI